MHARHRGTWTAFAVLPAMTAALLAISVDQASAATGGGSLLCKTTTLTPGGPVDAPFNVTVTANPSGPTAPTGASIAITGATVALTLPGAVTGNIKAQAFATAIALNQGIVKLDATHATGTLQATALAAPSQTITGYVPDPDGTGPGVAMADPITFTMTGVTFGSVTSAGTNGQSVSVSLAANASGDGFLFGLTGGIPTLGFGSLNSGFGGPGGGGICSNDTSATSGVPWAPVIASVALSGPTTPPPPTGTKTFTNTTKPKVTGTAKVGKTLTCKPGTWSPAPTTTTVRWLRDGKAIKKAVKAKYKVVKADARHRLSCTVKVAAAGFTDARATSAKTKVVPRPKKR